MNDYASRPQGKVVFAYNGCWKVGNLAVVMQVSEVAKLQETPQLPKECSFL